MTRNEFQTILRKKILLLDGATGTELHRAGLPDGVCPEIWANAHPEKLISVHQKYLDAGSDAIYTCTFGANRQKLALFDNAPPVRELNKSLAQLARRAVGRKKRLVIGDIGPTGDFVEPFGSLAFETAVEIFREQAEGLLAGGVDLFVIETMMDIQEARAALIAIRELCQLPVIVSMTFNEDGRTLNGTSPEAAVITLQSLGADVVGCNCSLGPRGMLNLVRAMKSCAAVPVLAKPNAGLPRLIRGKTVFEMKAAEFAEFADDFIVAGVNLFGGCCGTDHDFIAALREKLHGASPQEPLPPGAISAVSSARDAVFFGHGQPVKIIGERINPTGKKQIQSELKSGKFREIRRFAAEQESVGVDLLDVNVGMGGIDESATMRQAIIHLAPISNAPLCIDSANPETIENALRIYPGRALLNSISMEKERIDKVLPLAAKYGAMFILLPLSDGELPASAKRRQQLVNKILNRAAKLGIKPADVLVDGLVMTVSAEQDAARETLATVRWAHEHGLLSVLGLSNVSFGLPQRKWINSAFLAMASMEGVSAVIVNPMIEELASIRLAADALTGRDRACRNYISHFQNRSADAKFADRGSSADASPRERVYDAVLAGDREHISELIDIALQAGEDPGALVDEVLIPAINRVGELFDEKRYFLPQLILSAEAVKAAFKILEPKLGETGKDKAQKTRIILATVQGDIHDIGKNIVALMLRNYGFEVIDLGKDVSAADIVAAIKKFKVKIVGLSALMTTTMVRMPEVIDACRKAGLENVRFMVGGAVLTDAYAREIGADGFAADSVAAVRLAEKLAGNRS